MHELNVCVCVCVWVCLTQLSTATGIKAEGISDDRYHLYDEGEIINMIVCYPYICISMHFFTIVHLEYIFKCCGEKAEEHGRAD